MTSATTTPLHSALLALRPNAIPILALSLAQVDWTGASSSTRVPPRRSLAEEQIQPCAGSRVRLHVS